MGRLRELIKNFKELAPVLLELYECYKSMSVENQDRLTALLVDHVDDEDKEGIQNAMMSIRG